MFEEIKKLFVECANSEEDKVVPEARLKEDLGIDSLLAVEMVLELETHYGVMIDYDEMKVLKTVDDVIKLIEKKVGGKRA